MTKVACAAQPQQQPEKGSVLNGTNLRPVWDGFGLLFMGDYIG